MSHKYIIYHRTKKYASVFSKSNKFTLYDIIFPDFHLYDSQSQNYLLQLAEAIHFHGSIACMGFFVASNKYPILVKEHPMDEGHLEFVQLDCPMEPLFDPTPEDYENFNRILDQISTEVMPELMELDENTDSGLLK